MLPKEYQEKLLGEIISYQDGDKDYDTNWSADQH